MKDEEKKFNPKINLVENGTKVPTKQQFTIGSGDMGQISRGPVAEKPVQPPQPAQIMSNTPAAQSDKTVKQKATAAPQAAPAVQAAHGVSTQSSGGYQESDAVRRALEMLQQQQGSQPGAYQSQWQQQLTDTLNKILNREKFSYDMNGDALYQQYKDRYVQQGQQAMMDTMGQAALMTGGYGNSYAQSVGQQAYQGYLQGLNDKVPELYQLALDSYNQEGTDLRNQYAMLADAEGLDYDRYRDQMSDYYNNLDRLRDQYNQERNFDYGKWSDQRNYDYQKERDKRSDSQWDKSFQYQQNRDKMSDEQWQKQFDEAKRQYDQEWNYKYGSGSGSSGSSGGSSGGGSYSGGRGYDNGGYSSDIVRAAQKYVGADADGMWGSGSAAAAKAKGYGSLADVIKAMGGGGGKTGATSIRTYGDATKYLQANNLTTNGLMTKKQWDLMQMYSKDTGVTNPDIEPGQTYAEYLADFIQYQKKMAEKGG